MGTGGFAPIEEDEDSFTFAGTLTPRSVKLPWMNESFVLQGRRLGPVELGQVAEMIAENPGWSRYRLGIELARKWEWRSASGQLKDMAARTLLLKLEERGAIQLPARRCPSPNRMRHRQVPALDPGLCQELIQAPLAELTSGGARSQQGGSLRSCSL